MTTPQILIVDDEPGARETLADLFEDDGYKVATAASGEEAIEMCSEHRYSVILMDVRMPGIDGVEAFRRIRRHQPDVRVIIMTAYSTEELEQQALAEGAIAYLPKPLEISRVTELIGEPPARRILVVEEEDNGLRAVSALLSARGYSVTMVSSPTEAVDLAEQTGFDIILIDLDLASMNGLDLYLALRKITPASLCVLMSGRHAEMEDITVTVIHKPVDHESMLALLDKLVK
ncbi:MAG: response regulator [Bacteroidetes bacterium]|nr:response regulator [Bacteroidota bacterium]